jgi:hypothetical protein
VSAGRHKTGWSESVRSRQAREMPESVVGTCCVQFFQSDSPSSSCARRCSYRLVLLIYSRAGVSDADRDIPVVARGHTKHL